MRKEELFEAFSYIDDEVLKKASEDLFAPRRKPQKRAVMYVAAISAVIAVLASVLSLWSVLSKNRIDVTPSEIDRMFEKDGFNTNYRLVNTEDIEFFRYSKLPSDAEKVYVYKKNELSKSDKQENANEFLEAISQNRSEKLMWNTSSENKYDLTLENSCYSVTFSKYRSIYSVLGDKAFEGIVSESTEEESLFECVSVLDNYISGVFNTQDLFKEGSAGIVSTEGETVILKVRSGNLSERFDSFEFKFTGDENGILSLSEVVFEDIGTTAIVDDLLEIGVAEEMMKNGHTFANGFNCPICDRDLAFYDDCKRMLVYFTPENEQNSSDYVLPFYAFAMKVATDTYAVTYVPAIEIDGIDLFFEQKSLAHMRQVHSEGTDLGHISDLAGAYSGYLDQVEADFDIIDSQNASFSYYEFVNINDSAPFDQMDVRIVAKFTYKGEAKVSDGAVTFTANSKLVSDITLIGGDKHEYLTKKEKVLNQMVQRGQITNAEMEKTLDLLNGKESIEISCHEVIILSLDLQNKSFEILQQVSYKEDGVISICVYHNGMLKESISSIEKKSDGSEFYEKTQLVYDQNSNLVGYAIYYYKQK